MQCYSFDDVFGSCCYKPISETNSLHMPNKSIFHTLSTFWITNVLLCKVRVGDSHWTEAGLKLRRLRAMLPLMILSWL